MINRLLLETQTPYGELLEHLPGVEASRSTGHLPGAFESRGDRHKKALANALSALKTERSDLAKQLKAVAKPMHGGAGL